MVSLQELASFVVEMRTPLTEAPQGNSVEVLKARMDKEYQRQKARLDADVLARFKQAVVGKTVSYPSAATSMGEGDRRTGVVQDAGISYNDQYGEVAWELFVKDPNDPTVKPEWIRIAGNLNAPDEQTFIVTS